MTIQETRNADTVANILSFMTPKLPDHWTSYFQALVECSAAPAPLSVETCGVNFILKYVVHNNTQVASQVQGNVF